MSNTNEPEVTAQCPICHHWLQNDASIVIGHIKQCTFEKHPYKVTVAATVNIKVR